MATAIESYLVEYELRTGTSPGATP
jgi:hypothetical protein